MSESSLRLLIQEAASSPAERKIASVLLEGYPTRALTTVDALARLAGVSGPTVLRFVAKIGFARFADFQAAVLADVERQLGSPLRNLPADADVAPTDHVYLSSLRLQAEMLLQAATQGVPAEFDAMADLLANPRLSVTLTGGRYSQILAQRLATQLTQIRPAVRFLPSNGGFFFDALVDAGPQDLYVLFDYRRYQDDLHRFAVMAQQAGSRVALFTDTWRSPIADVADVVLTSPDASTSPFGSRVVATAQLEALVPAVIARRRDESRARLARIEDLRTQALNTPHRP